MRDSMQRIGLIVLCAAFLLSPSPTIAGDVDRTWKRCDEFSPQERALIDLRSETPRDEQVDYLPAEKYPFKPPFTAEELAYRVMNFPHNGRYPHSIADAWGTISKDGLFTHGITVTQATVPAGKEGVTGQLNAAPGEEFMRFVAYYTYPPKDRDLQALWVHRRTDRTQRMKIDNFMYVPYMRRVRRMPQFQRDAPLRGMVQSFDDIVGSAAWEFSWRFIGSDVLYETARFPQTRSELTLARADGSFYDVSTSDIRMMGDEYPFYTDDGGVECLVLVGETRKDWLPNYSTPKVIYWIDRHYSFPLRVESYDTNGELKKVQVRLAKQGNPALGPEGYFSLLTLYWDVDLDLLTYSLHDAYRAVEWTDEEASVMFSPEFMRRCWLKYAPQTHAHVGSLKEFYLRPSLDLEKFPEERRIHLKPDLEERIAAQEEAGHLVFSTSERGTPGGE
jgi:hypothetical protein